MAEDLRVAVIGLRHGERHIPGFQSVPGVTVSSICDSNPSTLARCAEQYGVEQTFQSSEDLLEAGNFDAAVMSVPNYLHEPIGVSILELGKHLLVDKPLAHTLEAAEKLVASGDAAGVELCVLQDFRAEPCAQFVWQAMQQGELGECYLARTIWHRRDSLPQPPKYGTWYAEKEKSGGGPLIDLGTHRLDLAMWLMSFPAVASVHGATFEHHMSAVPNADIEDTAAGFIRFENGSALIVETSFMGFANRLEDAMLDIRGTKGGARIVNDGDSYRQYTAELYSRIKGTHVDITPRVLPPTRSLYADFHETIVGSRPPSMCSGKEAAAVLRVIDGLYASAASHSH